MRMIIIDRKIGLVALSVVLVDMEMVLETWLPVDIDGRSMVKVRFDLMAGYLHIEIETKL